MTNENRVVWAGVGFGKPRINPLVIEREDGFEPIYTVADYGFISCSMIRMAKPEDAVAFFGLTTRQQCALLDRAETV